MVYRIITIIFPLFAVVLVGFFYARKHNPEMVAANRMTMEVFLPALIFTALASKSFNLVDNIPMAIGCAVVTLGSGLLAWPVARFLRIDPKTLISPAMFNNVGNMGLPLMLFTFGDEALGAAVVLMLVLIVLQFALSPWLLTGNFSLGAIWREPFLLASVAGVAVSLSGVALWPPLVSASKILGDIALGMMIFSLGVRLSSTRAGKMLRVGIAGGVVTPLTGMLTAWGFATLTGMSKAETDMLFLFGALPPAVGCFMFADRYKQEPDKVAAIVVIGNAMALFFIPFALALRL